MKQTAIIFCGSDAVAARKFAATIGNGDWNTVLASAYEFNRKEQNGKAYVMPDVPRWHKDRIAAAYPDFVDVKPKLEKIEDYVSDRVFDGVRPLSVKHRGRGRFFVMRGIEIVSGPHTKQEAQSLLK